MMLTDSKPKGYSVIYETADILFCLDQTQSKIYASIKMNTKSMLETVVNYYVQMKEWNSAIIHETNTNMEENVIQSIKTIKR